MLSSLHIENIAVIKSYDIEFSPGFTVITGETGSGKSIIVESISLLTGAPFKKEMLRTGESSAVVCGVYGDISEQNKQLISELGISPDEDGLLFVQREFSADGKSKNRINSRQVPLTTLRQVSEILLNIHGQHDNQKLLNSANHLSLVDSYSENDNLLNEYRDAYNKAGIIQNKLNKMKLDEDEKERRIDLLKYKIDAIDSLHLKPGEEEELESRLKLLKSLEKILKHSRLVYRALYKNGKGPSATSLIDMAYSSIDAIGDLNPNYQAQLEKLSEINSYLEDIAESVMELTSECGENPDKEIDRIESRLREIDKLERKYGSTIEEVLEYCAKAKEELSELDSYEIVNKELNRDLAKAVEEAKNIATRLHNTRQNAAEKLQALISNQLEFLDMKGAQFICDINYDEAWLCATGSDTVEFLLSANKGESPKPLSKIASGGELARIMLGIKSIFAQKEGTQTLIYDEIDTGISGKTSQKLGLVLHECSKSAQIICVTHSAQIAAACDNHLLVKKETVGNRVESTATYLTFEQRVREISRIMGGNKITDELEESARQLINQTKTAFNERNTI